jgi:hypothetical protein
MALSFPLSLPTSIGIESIELRAMNAVATSESPFTYKQQIHAHQGQRWEASVNVASGIRRDLAAPWKAFLTSLKGQQGTFLLGDPDYATPRGTVSACTLSGSAGDESVTVTMTGSLLAGDYIQLGSASTAKLHQVLADQTGNGTLEIWPGLRDDYTDATVIYSAPKGVFRLSTPMSSWSINNASAYGISFEAVEALV